MKMMIAAILSAAGALSFSPLAVAAAASTQSPEQVRKDALQWISAHITGSNVALNATLDSFLICSDSVTPDDKAIACVRQHLADKKLVVKGDLGNALEAASEVLRDAKLTPLREMVK